jgi:hypothetical protein
VELYYSVDFIAEFVKLLDDGVVNDIERHEEVTAAVACVI